MRMKMKTINNLVRMVSMLALLAVGGTAQGSEANIKEIPFSAIEGVQVGNA